MSPLEKIYDLLNKKLKLSKEEIDKAVETNIYLKKVKLILFFFITNPHHKYLSHIKLFTD